MRRHVLIIDRHQFGSLVDPYQYCRHLGKDLDFTYVCWDYGHPTPSVENTRVILVSRSGSKLARLSRFIRRSLTEMAGSKYDLHIVVYFAGCGILGLLSRIVPTVLDIRTGYVAGGRIRTWFRNALIAVESTFFSDVSIITEGLRKQLRLKESKCVVIPLGADPIEVQRKDFSCLKLLYVGTLQHRRIHDTVRGLSLFCQRAGADVLPEYEIVGSGRPSDEEALRAAIAECACGTRIRYYGRVPHSELLPFFQRNNVGVAYIPIVPAFESQPSTKVFEYLLAGMVVLATETTENRRVITTENGVLCRDTPEGFCSALADLHRLRVTYDSAPIRLGTERHTWAHITRDQLLPYWRRLMEGSTRE